MTIDNSPEDCQVKAKFALDPSAKVRKSNGESVPALSVTATCPNFNNCVVHSARKGLKFCNKK